jgi:hypothetical protein
MGNTCMSIMKGLIMNLIAINVKFLSNLSFNTLIRNLISMIGAW